MGSSASIALASEKVMAKDNGLSDSLSKFVSCFIGLATKGELARGARITAWMSVDNNGNGMVSLAEVDGWIQKVLQAEFGENDEYLSHLEALPPLLHPCVQRRERHCR